MLFKQIFKKKILKFTKKKERKVKKNNYGADEIKKKVYLSLGL